MSTNQREFGLDVYRILAIVLITTLHTVNQHFHMLDIENALSQFAFGNFVEFACYCGVDCFALLSGFLLANTQWSYDTRWLQRIGNLWVKMLAWGFGIWFLIHVALHFGVFGVALSYPLTIKGFIKLLCPMTYGWWYINAYMGMLFLLPLILKGLATFPGSELAKMSFLLFLGFSFIPTFTHSSGGMTLCGGYSTIWLTLCFLWGYALRKNINVVLGIRRVNIWLWVGTLLCVSLPYSFFMFMKTHGLRGGGFFMSYLSPFCVLEAVCLLILCYQVRIEKRWLQRVVAFISSNALGIYLLQSHPGVWSNFVVYSGGEVPGVLQAIWKIPCYVFSLGLLGVICNYAIEKILTWLKIPKIIGWLSDKVITHIDSLICK